MSQVLVEVWRGPLIESVHRGDLAVVDVRGELLYAYGHATRVTYARSAAKPLQLVPLLETGAAAAYGLSDQEIAVCCASHNGEDSHVETVRGLLRRAGIPESCLRCGVHPPYYAPAYEGVLRDGGDVLPIHNNCSGKHAGMLLLAQHLGADLDTYLDPDHPVQKKVLQAVSELTEVAADEIVVGTDGCGLPVFGLPLRNLALAYARLGQPDGLSPGRRAALARIRDAMMNHPHFVAGTDRFCTRLMEAAPGSVVAKVGAEGVYCVALPELGWGLALKIDDGNSRAAYPTVVEALAQMQALPSSAVSELAEFHRPMLTNHQGKVVGQVVPNFRLESMHV
ncbi:asparaginase [Alicyclobacillus shizuokensis]|uniref:asparaginase n=1 Tax=Alicyclobacillus shizuokensis TaxID=392014 RepID=UPI00082C57EF|nr:asparaginase [Alicyclobacillus shizuokensis]MCL6625829.1 asparaginase [Alicyclobacillus shizuokensis]